MFKGYSSNKTDMVLFSGYLDYDVWKIMLEILVGAILENKNIMNIMNKEI